MKKNLSSQRPLELFHRCRGPTFTEFKAGVARRYSVPVENVIFKDNNLKVISDDTKMDDITEKFIAVVKEQPTHGPPRETSWVFWFQRG